MRGFKDHDGAGRLCSEHGEPWNLSCIHCHRKQLVPARF